MERATQKRRKFRPKTLAQVVSKAERLRYLLVDLDWHFSPKSRTALKKVLDDLESWIPLLSFTAPKQTARRLEYRLARAEAEQCRGAILLFQRKVTHAYLQNEAPSSASSLESHAAEDLDVALGRFLSLAKSL
jgi:hypothetical protein